MWEPRRLWASMAHYRDSLTFLLQGLELPRAGGAQYPVTQTTVLASVSCWLVREKEYRRVTHNRTTILASVRKDNSDKKLSSTGRGGGGGSNGLVIRSNENRYTQIRLKKRNQTDKTKHRKTTVKMGWSAYSSRGWLWYGRGLFLRIIRTLH
jgi:hypothetical protein